MKTTGNTILITGGTSGIGLGLALRLDGLGNKVVVAGRRQELLDEITAEHPGIEGLHLDVAEPDSITRALDAVAANHPGLNVLINNAGIMLPENLLEPAGVAVAVDHVVTNLLGTIRMTYAFLPLLQQNADAAIMNVTSALAFVPYPAAPTYSATKAALHSFSESLRVQLARGGSDVQVIEIVPPGVRTTLMGQQDDERAMPLEDFLTQTLDELHENPNANELVVEHARFLRDAVGNGSYGNVLSMLSDA